MSRIDLEKSKDKYESINMPEGLDIMINSAMKKGKRYRMIKKRMPMYGVAAMFIMFILVINTSVAFAQAVKSIPIIKDFADLVIINQGIKYAVNEGYVQYVNKSVEINGVKVTITRIVGDNKELIFGYTVEGETINQDSFYGLKNIEVETIDGEAIKAFISYGAGDYKKDGLKPLENEKYFSVKNVNVDDILKDVVVTFEGILEYSEKYESGNNEVVDENVSEDFRIPVKIEEKIVNVVPEAYSINRSIELGEQSIFVKEMKVYPMGIEVVINMSVDENNDFSWFDNCYIEDEKGRVFTLSSGISSGEEVEEYTINFNGGAYNRSKELTLYSKGMFYKPKEMKQIVVDLKNKALVDDGGYGIELYDIRYPRELTSSNDKENENSNEGNKENDDIKGNVVKGFDLGHGNVDLIFTTKPEYRIDSISLRHSKSKEIATAVTDTEGSEGKSISVYISFNSEDLTEELLYINVDSIMSGKMKTDGFSFKLK
ncbi:MAG: DUF4179 domain-containing protein [Clostridium sp.]|uniref:DUF4179 domain-containing protein n=1 Tax=Clostridium sp. TaxID=1506 RepID=UPI00305A2BC1